MSGFGTLERLGHRFPKITLTSDMWKKSLLNPSKCQFSNKSWPFPEVIYILYQIPTWRAISGKHPPTFASSNSNTHLCRLNHRHLKSWGEELGCEIDPNVDLLLVVGKKKSSPKRWFNGDLPWWKEKMILTKQETNESCCFLITIAKVLPPKFPSWPQDVFFHFLGTCFFLMFFWHSYWVGRKPSQTIPKFCALIPATSLAPSPIDNVTGVGVTVSRMNWTNSAWQRGLWVQMGVSKNNGTPKWMVYNGKP